MFLSRRIARCPFAFLAPHATRTQGQHAVDFSLKFLTPRSQESTSRDEESTHHGLTFIARFGILQCVHLTNSARTGFQIPGSLNNRARFAPDALSRKASNIRS